MKNISLEELGVHIEPLGYRILLREPVIPQKTQGGIILPEALVRDTSSKGRIGKILACGETAFEGAAAGFAVDAGEWVIYSGYEREKVVVGEDEAQRVGWFVNDDRILGLVSEEVAQKLSAGGV